MSRNSSSTLDTCFLSQNATIPAMGKNARGEHVQSDLLTALSAQGDRSQGTPRWCAYPSRCPSRSSITFRTHIRLFTTTAAFKTRHCLSFVLSFAFVQRTIHRTDSETDVSAIAEARTRGQQHRRKLHCSSKSQASRKLSSPPWVTQRPRSRSRSRRSSCMRRIWSDI